MIFLDFTVFVSMIMLMNLFLVKNHPSGTTTGGTFIFKTGHARNTIRTLSKPDSVKCR